MCESEERPRPPLRRRASAKKVQRLFSGGRKIFRQPREFRGLDRGSFGLKVRQPAKRKPTVEGPQKETGAGYTAPSLIAIIRPVRAAHWCKRYLSRDRWSSEALPT